MEEGELIECCEKYIYAVFNACAIISQCGAIISCYSFEQERQQLHEELSEEMDIPYDKLGEVLGNLEEEIGFPSLRGKSEDEIFRVRDEKYKEYGKKLYDRIRRL